MPSDKAYISETSWIFSLSVDLYTLEASEEVINIITETFLAYSSKGLEK